MYMREYIFHLEVRMQRVASSSNFDLTHIYLPNSVA